MGIQSFPDDAEHHRRLQTALDKRSMGSMDFPISTFNAGDKYMRQNVPESGATAGPERYLRPDRTLASHISLAPLADYIRGRKGFTKKKGEIFGQGKRDSLHTCINVYFRTRPRAGDHHRAKRCDALSRNT